MYAFNLFYMETPELILSVKQKTESLIERHRSLLERISNLENQLEKQNRQFQQVSVDKDLLIAENKELKEQIKTIKLAQSLTTGNSDQNSRHSKTKINEYIREIDKCLSLLNRE